MLVRMHCNKRAIIKRNILDIKSQCFILEQIENILAQRGTLYRATKYMSVLSKDSGLHIQSSAAPLRSCRVPKVFTGHYQVIKSHIDHMRYVSDVVVTFDIGAIVTVSVISVSHLPSFPLKLIVLQALNEEKQKNKTQQETK